MAWKRWIRRTVAAVLATWVLLTVWFVSQRQYRLSVGNRELTAAVQEAAATDPDWDWNRLNAARHRPADGKNGADMIPKVRDLLPAEWVRDVNAEPWEPNVPLTAPNIRYSSQAVADARRKLARAGAAIALARTLKDCPTGRRDLPLTPDVLSTPMRDTPHTRTVARLLRWDAILAAEDFDATRLTDDLLALLNTSRSVGDEPLLISQLIRVAVRRLAAEALERALAHVQLAPESLATLQAVWAADAEEPLLLYGVRGERAAYDVFLRNLADGTYVSASGKSDDWFDNYTWWLARGRLPRDRAYYLGWMNQAVAAAHLPPHQQFAAVKALPELVTDDPGIRFSLLILPAVEKVATATLRSTAEARCAVVGIACERFRQQHKHWPESLAELVPAFISAVPLDPYRRRRRRGRARTPGTQPPS